MHTNTEKTFEPISREEIKGRRTRPSLDRVIPLNVAMLKSFHFWAVHILAVIGAAFIIGVAWLAYGPPTYGNNDELVTAIHQGTVLSGDTADLLVLDVEENLLFGYNLTVADDVVLVGYEGLGVQEGDEIRITIGTATNPTGYAWMVTYDLQDIH